MHFYFSGIMCLIPFSIFIVWYLIWLNFSIDWPLDLDINNSKIVFVHGIGRPPSTHLSQTFNPIGKYILSWANTIPIWLIERVIPTFFNYNIFLKGSHPGLFETWSYDLQKYETVNDISCDLKEYI